jgi:hypothetical protein
MSQLLALSLKMRPKKGKQSFFLEEYTEGPLPPLSEWCKLFFPNHESTAIVLQTECHCQGAFSNGSMGVCPRAAREKKEDISR